MNVIINGEKKQLKDCITIGKILSEYKINRNYCLVEWNGLGVGLNNIDTAIVKEGDQLELIKFVGGG